MTEKKVHKLKINMEFKHLIRPLKEQEYLQLEANIISDGCRDAIITWKGYIVDGHNRYKICTDHNIPFAVMEMDFECKEAAIAWICANQLGRRNITPETRKFLIGMQYESEKIVSSIKNRRGNNQYRSAAPEKLSEESDQVSRHQTAAKIASEHQISNGSVQKYAMYTRALEEIGKAAPTLVPNILSGRYKISHKNIIDLSKMPPEDIKKVARKIEKSEIPYVQYQTSRQEIQGTASRFGRVASNAPSVKDMPAYDPDAEITGLTLTIPSWASSIDRTMKKADLTGVSDNARSKLAKALHDLQDTIADMLTAIKED